MTTLCRSDWIQAFGEQELRVAKIDPLNLPVTSFEKIIANSPAPAKPQFTACLAAHNNNYPEYVHD